MIGNARDEMLQTALQTCDELLSLTRAQRDAIDRDDMDRLSDLIERRETLISSIDFRSIDGDEFSCTASKPGSTTNQKSLLIERLQELLREDEDNQRAVQARMAEIKAKLGGMSRGRQALRQYAYLKPLAEPVYIDRRR